LITEELITKFFEGKCDAGDGAIVQAWLNENPAKLKEYFGVEEWEDFQPVPALSPEMSRKLWKSINRNTSTPTLRHSFFRWTAVAASLLLITGLSWQFILKRQKTPAIGAATVGTSKNIFNQTPQKMALELSDGSTVELAPNSKLSYPENFTPLERDVTVSGEANFNITNDAAKPFSVYCNSLLVRVLGTRFTVRSNDANTITKVILQEGKVVVSLPNASAEDHKSEYYLSPGDIFVFKKANRQKDSLSARVLHLEKDKDGHFVFNNYPLDIVFDQLQIIYNTKILYDKAELGNRSFIGKIDQRDSLYQILHSIALLNRFGFHREGDGFFIGN
jgi:ferric-dicitrate binding protein FerR (iron transport regulator)